MVTAAGVDTWGVAWYLDEDKPAFRAAKALAIKPAKRAREFTETIAGHRVYFAEPFRLLYVEGHPKEGGLGCASDLAQAHEDIREGLSDRGVTLGRGGRTRPTWAAGGLRDSDWEGFAGIRRIDTTVDLRFDHSAEGLAALSGVAALPLPRMKTATIRETGGSRLETVYFRGHAGKSVLGRWYDKGVHPETTERVERGVWIRPEDQRRFAKGSRPAIDHVADGRFIRALFQRRFYPLWQASKGIKVGSPIELARKLVELQDEGVVTPAQAKAIAGSVLLNSVNGHRQSERQVRRDRSLARRHGLVLADGVLDDVDVDLEEILEAALDSEPWGSDW